MNEKTAQQTAGEGREKMRAPQQNVPRNGNRRILLMAIFDSIQPETYAKTVRKLRNIRDIDERKRLMREALNQLTELMSHEDDRIQGGAADALGELGDISSFKILLRNFRGKSLKFIRRDSHSAMLRVAFGAGIGLAKLGTNESIQALLNAIQGRPSFERDGAAVGLGYVHTEESRKALREALKSRGVMCEAIKSLGMLNDKEAIPLIRDLLGKHDWVVNLYVKRVLKVLEGNSKPERLEKFDHYLK